MPAEKLPTIFVIFGATGDLAKRKLIPALWRLYKSGQLPGLLQIVAFARREMSEAGWQKYVENVLGDGDDEKRQEFSKLFVYQQGFFEKKAGYRALAERLGRQDETWRVCANKLFYLAVPPQHYEMLFKNLAESGLTEPCSADEGWTRVIVEKPFGKDAATAQRLDEDLGKLFKEEQIYRIDHYLGKETVRNILAFRFSNVFLEPAWNNRSIAAIHVNAPETDTVGARGSFYDGVGALRDVGQNHMLQLLALFMMDKPKVFAAEEIRRERTRVLEALEIMDDTDVARQTRRGQYEGYQAENGVAAGSQTETYFKIEARLNVPEWHSVPIYLESGKALSESKVEVIVKFRHQTPCLCPPGVHYTNELRYQVQPDEGVHISFWVKKPGKDMVIEQQDFSYDFRESYARGEFIDAYEKLLLDAVAGDQTLFVSTDEIFASWRFIDPIVRAWQKDVVPLKKYKAGIRPALHLGGASVGSSLTKPIGFVGLGKMGANMVARLREYDWQVVATDKNKALRIKNAESGTTIVEGAADVVQQLPAPRLLWLMVPHQVVDDVLEEVTPYLEKGDVVIDGGNSFYKDSIRRAERLEKKGVSFLDVGVSGGPSGARAGACLMVGGEREVYRDYMGLFGDLAVAGGFDYVGGAGAGHFVKMVHNGIEYGIMQALGEGFAVLKEWPFDPAQGKQELNLERIANLFNHGSVIESRLVSWLKDAFDKYGPELKGVAGRVAHSGEGQWTVEAAAELGIPVPIIERALKFRVDSANEPSYTGQILTALRNQFGGHQIK